MMNKITSRGISVLFALGCLSVLAGAQQPAQKQKHTDVSWVFDVRLDRNDNPQNKVFLVVNGRRVLLLSNVSEGFRVIEPGEYSSHDVPATAITACFGWWAGQGKEMYVTRRNRRLIVFIRDVGEGSELHPPYRRLRIIPER